MQESAIFKDEIAKTLKSGAPVPVPGLFLEMVNCVLWRVGKSVFNPTIYYSIYSSCQLLGCFQSAFEKMLSSFSHWAVCRRRRQEGAHRQCEGVIQDGRGKATSGPAGKLHVQGRR